MNKKYKKIIISIILLLIIFLLTSCSVSYTKEETIKLIEKTSEITNYSIEISSDNQSLLMQQKDNIYVITSLKENEDTYKIYENLDKDEIIIMDEKYAIVTSISKYSSEDSASEYLEPYMKSVLDTFKSDNFEYTFLEKVKYNNESCIVVKLKNIQDTNENSDSNEIAETKYTISTKTGMIYKIEQFDLEGNLIEAIDYDVTINTVKDEDVERPDLTNVETFEI